MSDEEMTEKEQISDEHQEILYRLDERTEQINDTLDSLTEDIEQNTTDIDKLQSQVKRNSTLLGGVGTGVTTVILWFADKVTRVLP